MSRPHPRLPASSAHGARRRGLRRPRHRGHSRGRRGDAAPHASATANPYNPSSGHPYRHGVIPTLQQHQKMQSWDNAHARPATTGPETLSYGGGIDGIGVQDGGKSKVYLVFYGSQWGSQTTDANGNAKFSGDPDSAAGAAQQMFKGIGTNGELWSADLTQWCDGPGVAAGAVVCPTGLPASQYVNYQSGGVLAGVWEDTSTASPSAASGHQLGQEAVNAAAHFGNTTAAANRDAYYVILSPHGTNPDQYQNQYCAWHDYNGDSTLTGGAVTSPTGTSRSPTSRTTWTPAPAAAWASSTAPAPWTAGPSPWATSGTR
ncbi:hypothetical protein ACFQ9X_21250 [Catenulispora yoronensis]